MHVNTVITTGVSDSKVWNRLAENPDHTTALGKVLSDYNDDEPSIATAQHYALEAIDGIDAFDGDEETRVPFIESNSDFFDEFSPDVNPTYASLFVIRMSHTIAVLRNSNPNYYNNHPSELLFTAFRHTLSSDIHLALDLAGMFPALGAIPDGINIVFYAIEGDWTNAAMSSASFVPIVGQGATIAKLGMAFTNRAGKIGLVGTRTVLQNGTDVVDFSRNSNKSFADFWGFPRLTNGLVTHGHHLIPKAPAFLNHPVIQKAAKAASSNADEFPFHPHHVENGIPLDPTQHLPGHAGYSERVLGELNRVMNSIDNLPAEDVARAIRNWQSALRSNVESITQAGGNLGQVPIPFINFN
jgi:hypothetical protein